MMLRSKANASSRGVWYTSTAVAERKRINNNCYTIHTNRIDFITLLVLFSIPLKVTTMRSFRAN